MNRTVFVGSLSFTATEDELKAAFGQFGEVKAVRIVCDRETGKPRGFAFVELGNSDEAARAIAAMDGALICGRTVKCSPSTSAFRPGERGNGQQNGRR